MLVFRNARDEEEITNILIIKKEQVEVGKCGSVCILKLGTWAHTAHRTERRSEEIE